VDAIQEKPRVDVVLVALGTPEELSVNGIRNFLKRFLSDKRVIEASSLIWTPILYGVILPFRPKKLIEGYRSIWSKFGDSPLRVFTKEQVKALQSSFDDDELSQECDFFVHGVMLYDAQNVTQKIVSLTENYSQAGKETDQNKVVVLPLYPQYSATTTAAVYDQVFKACLESRNIVDHVVIKHYFQHHSYRKVLADSVKTFWSNEGKGDYLLASFHGIPQEYVTKGDPYQKQCEATANNLLADLECDIPFSWSFQSRLGPKKWLTPYTDVTVQELAKKGIKTLDVICPSFSSDCLETLEEIAIEAKEIFCKYGGESLRLIPSLNSEPAHIKMFKELVLEKI
jgi:protoporphyrin/coproporphyrin ferrochelatase